MGVLQHSLTLYPREGQTREVLKWTGWNLRYEAKSMSPFDECLTPNHNFLMNIVIWVYKKKKKNHHLELEGCSKALFSKPCQRAGLES